MRYREEGAVVRGRDDGDVVLGEAWIGYSVSRVEVVDLLRSELLARCLMRHCVQLFMVFADVLMLL